MRSRQHRPLDSSDTLFTFYTVVTTIEGEELVPFHDGPLSQWWPSPFTHGADNFPTAEHWMMYRKAQVFGDRRAMEDVLAADHPREAKAIGRGVHGLHGFDERVWNRVSPLVVYEGNLLKFTQNREECRILRETAGRTIVEASPSDRIWGVGLHASEARLMDRAQWRGMNRLGRVLDAVYLTLSAGA